MLSDKEKKSIVDFPLNKIPEADFLSGFGATPESVKARVLSVLQRALGNPLGMPDSYGVPVLDPTGGIGDGSLEAWEEASLRK